MMNQPSITKLNRRLIYICLMVSVSVAVPLIVIPMASATSSKDDQLSEKSPEAFAVDVDDAFALSGTQHFPKTYAGLQEFEKTDVVKPKTPADVDPLFIAFDNLSTVDKSAETNRQFQGVAKSDDDPWREARQAEQRKRAFDHYDARRSDIMFVNNSDANRAGSSNDSEMEVIKRSLDLAERQMNQDEVFFERAGGKSSKGLVGKIKDAEPFMVSEGTLIPTILLSEIDTSLPGPILARVSQNIWDSKTGQTLLIPQNSQLIGEYDSSIGHGQTRAQIVWKRIIFPNQQSVNLGAMVAVDKRGTSGAAGSVDNHYDKVALGLILTTVLGGGVRMAQGKYEPTTATMGQEFGNALAQESARLGNKITDKMLSIKPTIKVAMGKRLNVFVEQDLSLQPYSG